MKHLKSLFACLVMLFFTIGQVWGADVITPTSGSQYRIKAVKTGTGAGTYYMVAPTTSGLGGATTTEANGTIFTFTQESSKWYITFTDGSKTYYMYEHSDNGKVNISTTKTEVAIGTNGNYIKIGSSKWIQFNYNSGNPRVGAYSSSQTGVVLTSVAAAKPTVSVDPESVEFGPVKQYTTTDESNWVLADVDITGANLTDDVVLTSNYSAVFNILDPTKGSGVAASYTIKPNAGAIDTTITVVAYTNADVTLDKTITVSSAKETPDFEAFNIPVSITVTPRYSVSVAVNDEEMGSATINGKSFVYGDEDDTELALVATANSGYEFVNWEVTDGDENDIEITSTTSASTLAGLVTGSVTITANFQAQSCTNLAAPTLNKLTKSYDYANLKWTAVTNAEKYRINVVKHEGSVPHITNLLTPDLETDILNLDANTQYDYTVMAVGDGSTYCDESNPLLEGSFTTNDYPAATLTLSENGVTRTLAGEHKLNDIVVLPTAVAEGNEVVGKVLVGYTNEANKEYAHDTDAPAVFYAKGANYTIAAEADKLYAVYAIQGGEEGSTTNIKYTGSTTTNMSGSNDAETFGLDADEWSVVGAKGSNSNYPGLNKAGDIRLYYHADGSNTLTITAPEDIDSVKISFNTGYDNCSVIVGGNTVAAINGAYPIGATTFIIGNANTSNVQVQMTNIAVVFSPNYTYTKYATTGAKAPQATVEPTSVALGAAAVVGGLIDVTYANVNTANVSVALFNDEACKTTFSGEWLNVSLDANKDIEYGAAAAVSYANARKAYIKLTAPSPAEGVDPAVVVIPVTQAKKEAVFASLAELVASDLAEDSATVSFENIAITGFYKTVGVYLNVKGANDKNIEVYRSGSDIPDTWAEGGTLSGTVRGLWTYYNDGDVWEIVPKYGWAWANLTYKAPSGLAWSAETGKAYTVVKAAVLPELTNPNSLTVTYSSTDETVATINASGEITPLKDGTTTIKATFLGNDEYKAAEVSYTLNVYEPESIAITGELEKTEYESGDAFDRSGLKAILTFSDDETEDVTDMITWLIDGEASATVYDDAQFGVTAKYNENILHYKSFDVTVNKHEVTFENPSHGTLVVKKNNGLGWVAITSGDTFVKGTTLRVEPAAESGYKLQKVTINGETLEAVESIYSFEVGTANVAVAAVFSVATAIDNTEVETKAVKFIENGQIFILRGEKVYTIDGQLVK